MEGIEVNKMTGERLRHVASVLDAFDYLVVELLAPFADAPEGYSQVLVTLPEVLTQDDARALIEDCSGDAMQADLRAWADIVDKQAEEDEVAFVVSLFEDLERRTQAVLAELGEVMGLDDPDWVLWNRTSFPFGTTEEVARDLYAYSQGEYRCEGCGDPVINDGDVCGECDPSEDRERSVDRFAGMREYLGEDLNREADLKSRIMRLFGKK